MDSAAGQWQFSSVSALSSGPAVSDQKLQQLEKLLKDLGSCLVAYSGGVDSAFLALKAHQLLGPKSLAVIADSPSLPRRELAEALDLARDHGFPVQVIQTDEFNQPEYLANPANRCYFCKHELFSRLIPLARAENFQAVVYGENASDLADVRPGAQAAREFQVRAPLKEAGLSKQEIRTFSRALGLPTADKPQLACLSSRIPHGQLVSVEKLAMVEAAEQLMRERNFYDVRVRHLEEGSGALARIEVGPEEIPRLHQLFPELEPLLRGLGYDRVEVDPRGYRRPAVPV